MATGWWWLIGSMVGIVVVWLLARLEQWHGQRMSKGERQRVADAIEALQREVQR